MNVMAESLLETVIAAVRRAHAALVRTGQKADTEEKRGAVAQALIFKCNVLWAQLDALNHAYVLGGGVPKGAFVPEDAAPQVAA